MSNCWAAAATDIENGVVIAGVVQTVHTDRSASYHYAVPAKSCTLDPVQTFLVREFVDLLLPFLTTFVNTSLMQGRSQRRKSTR